MPSLQHLIAIAPFLAATATPAWAQRPPTTLPQPTVSLPPEVETVLRAYERAWIAKDTAALAQLFTPDGMALPNGSPPAQGQPAIAAEYARNAGSPLALRPIVFSQSQDLAYVVGAFNGGAGQSEFGKFVLVLRRTADGKWRIAADMDNMNFRPTRPPAQAASSPARP